MGETYGNPLGQQRRITSLIGLSVRWVTPEGTTGSGSRQGFVAWYYADKAYLIKIAGAAPYAIDVLYRRESIVLIESKMPAMNAETHARALKTIENLRAQMQETTPP